MKIGDKITDGSASFIVRKIGGGGQLIKGIIMAFSGTFDSNGYPIDPDTNTGDTGWHICDWTHGTPDLRGRFILGASDGYAVGSTGGEENHTLTIDEMPWHRHTCKIFNNNNENFDMGGYGYRVSGGTWVNGRTAGQDGGDRCGESTYSGSGWSHNNMPHYYALSYIMKV